MRRSKAKAPPKNTDRIGYDDKTGKKKFYRRTAENQIAVRGSKALGAYLVAEGTVLKNKPNYTIVETKNPARINRQGTVYVGAHTRRTIEPTRSNWGRDFQQSDHAAKNRKRKGSARMIKSGRIIPILGYGFMAYNILGAPVDPTISRQRDMLGRTLPGALALEAEYHAFEARRQGFGGTMQSIRSAFNPVTQFNKAREMGPVWKKL
jgi:hypothetical protein